ncbi:tetratricopeptide repeat-containing sulfotransferase family protein [Pseudoxanthomonas winnipegensis]|uniref:tetratricopeptide repeat-containing sulfotransferase family protein n=1 Tax=Pseudoxanthomonas winnipegensis TaxID=2480810 RepID=UPI001D19476F|nr:sulfotransferase [Pseudoxanthomonas winnipegensis]
MKADQIEQHYAQAVAALNHGAWRQAAQLASQLLPVAASHAGVQFVAGVAALGLRAMKPAVVHLNEAVKLNPSRADYRAQLARAWCSAGNLRAAHEQARVALGLPIEDAVSANTLGVVLTQTNDHPSAVTAFARATALAPVNATYRFNHATSLTFVGALDRAEGELEACLRLQPRYWKAHLALSQHWTHDAQSNHIARLRTLLATHGSDEDAVLHLNLALSRELEDLGEFEEALSHLVAGKSVVARRRNYRWQRDAARFQQLSDVFSSMPRGGNGHGSQEPIFVVGMPRSGTTLVERILSSHPQVHSAGELNNFPIEVRRSCAVHSPSLLDEQVIASSERIDWRALGQRYIDSTRPGTGLTPRFVDKLPHNFLYIGHIFHALPNARIVCLERDPMDTCLGNFRQLFATDSEQYDYSFDLLDTGHYVLLFQALMERWHSQFPGRIHRVRYEALVADQEATTRALLEFCGLPWDTRCLAFHDNPAASATASAVQVRQPLHAGFQGRWRRYGDALAPLQALLDEARQGY